MACFLFAGKFVSVGVLMSLAVCCTDAQYLFKSPLKVFQVEVFFCWVRQIPMNLWDEVGELLGEAELHRYSHEYL